MAYEVGNDHTTRRRIGYLYDDDGNLVSEDRTGVDVRCGDQYVRYSYDRAGQQVGTFIEGVTRPSTCAPGIVFTHV